MQAVAAVEQASVGDANVGTHNSGERAKQLLALRLSAPGFAPLLRAAGISVVGLSSDFAPGGDLDAVRRLIRP